MEEGIFLHPSPRMPIFPRLNLLLKQNEIFDVPKPGLVFTHRYINNNMTDYKFQNVTYKIFYLMFCWVRTEVENEINAMVNL